MNFFNRKTSLKHSATLSKGCASQTLQGESSGPPERKPKTMGTSIPESHSNIPVASLEQFYDFIYLDMKKGSEQSDAIAAAERG